MIALQRDTPGACPHADRDARKSAAPAGQTARQPLERAADGTVRIGSFALARQVLRSGTVRQAGFKAELLERFRMRRPVLFQEGEVHQKQRKATARFFAPRVVTTRYRDLMTGLSDRLVQRLRADGHADLDAMSLTLAVTVTAEIIGLTDSSRPGMAGRLNSFFAVSAATTGKGPLAALASFVLGQVRMLRFYLYDVRSAIRARRAARREDVISHLLDQGYTDREILTECLTYGAAGMATTREFIVMAAWHLLDRDALRERFLAVDEPGRITILEEILRLEPVIGALHRRGGEDLVLDDDGRAETIPAGTLIAIDIRAANADPAAAGRCPRQLDPDRKPTAEKAGAALLSFGDGPHRCPGAAVALQETAIFLDRLLRVPGLRLERPPSVSWNPLIAGYELRGAALRIG